MQHPEKKKMIVTDLSKEFQKAKWAVMKAQGSSEQVPSLLSRFKNRKVKDGKQTAVVLTFNGDMRASETADFSKAVSLILSTGQYCGEVYIKLTSGGGTVNGYGLLAAEIQRMKDANLQVTVLIDEVAASGGYMAACVADSVVAAPFAYIGSIGVVAEMPNFNEFLSQRGVNVEQHTAGDRKRTITPMGKVTDEGREAFKEKLNDIHTAFKDHVEKYRDLDDVSLETRDEIFSGDYWLAQETVDNGYGLVDEIMTSESFLLSKMECYRLIEITFTQKKKKRFGLGIGASIAELVDAVAGQIESRIYDRYVNRKGLH